jgi:hypothetical protein
MPSFSGSLMSLARLLNLLKANPAGRQSVLKGTVFGGHISSSRELDKFRHITGRDFWSGITSASDYKTAFCHTLKRYGIKAPDAAILAEDETVYGKAFGEGCKIASYTYSRDISHLRNIYMDDANADSPDKKSAPRSGVAFSVKDSANGEDSVPVFSEGQAPLSQNAVLSSIFEEFRRKRTRLVYIIATNTLDALFLTRVMRHEVPDTRIILDNPDMLFLAAAAQYPLTGTVFFSTYPNFMDGERWLTPTNKGYIVFPDDTSHGQYGATSALVSELGIAQGNAQRLVGTRPGIWTLVLGHRGFLPVDLIDSNDKLAVAPFAAPPRTWFVATGLVIALMLVATWLLLSVNLSRTPVWPFWLYVPRGVYAKQPILAPLACVALAVSACEFCLIFPAAVSGFQPELRALNVPFRIWAAITGVLVCLIPLIAVGYLWWRRRAKVGRRQGLSLAVALLLWLLVLLFWSRSCLFLAGHASQLFCYRALELESGGSPTLPFLALAVAAAAGGLYYARRLALCGPGMPQLPLSVLQTVPLE